ERARPRTLAGSSHCPFVWDRTGRGSNRHPIPSTGNMPQGQLHLCGIILPASAAVNKKLHAVSLDRACPAATTPDCCASPFTSPPHPREHDTSGFHTSQRVLYGPQEGFPLAVQQRIVRALSPAHLDRKPPRQLFQPFDPRLDLRHAHVSCHRLTSGTA